MSKMIKLMPNMTMEDHIELGLLIKNLKAFLSDPKAKGRIKTSPQDKANFRLYKAIENAQNAFDEAVCRDYTRAEFPCADRVYYGSVEQSPLTPRHIVD